VLPCGCCRLNTINVYEIIASKPYKTRVICHKFITKILNGMSQKTIYFLTRLWVYSTENFGLQFNRKDDFVLARIRLTFLMISLVVAETYCFFSCSKHHQTITIVLYIVKTKLGGFCTIHGFHFLIGIRKIRRFTADIICIIYPNHIPHFYLTYLI